MWSATAVTIAILSLSLAAPWRTYPGHHDAIDWQTVPWEAPVRPGAETDFAALDRLAGDDAGARYVEERWKGRAMEVKFQQYQPHLPLKKKVTLFTAVPAHDFPDVLGEGRKFLLKDGDKYFLLTKSNLARAYAPLDESDILPYMVFYQELFENPFATVVIDPSTVPGVDIASSASSKARGFQVRLVTNNRAHESYVAQKDYFIWPDGIVKDLTKPKILQRSGPGIMF